jgi:hypothetical protein
MLPNDKEQKSPARRFLLILGVVAFLCFFSLGMMIIFWDSMVPSLSKWQKIGCGVLIIIYSVIRFARLLRRERNEE